MTNLQAFDAMREFFKCYWYSTGRKDELAILLSSMDNSMCADNLPVDAALWEQWTIICDQILTSS